VLEKGQCLQDNIYYYGDYENTSYSYTDVEDIDLDEDIFNLLEHYEVPIYAVPSIFGTTGNAILLIIIICNKDMRTVPNIYILNLGISDMIYLMVHFAESCADRISDTWKESDFTCQLIIFCYSVSIGVSAYSVAVLSIQRYRVTVSPFHVRVSSQPTWRVTVATICGVWIVAALFAVPSAFLQDLCQERYYSHASYHRNVVVFELLVFCALPLCVIAFSYIMTARHLLKSAQPISEETQNPKLKTRKNTAKIVVGLTVVFIISYVPYYGYWTYNTFEVYLNPDTEWDYGISPNNWHIFLVSDSFLLINPCFNPVALFCTSLAFRRQFKRYLTCCFKVKSPVTNIELIRRN
jgi:hypothetical protein